jgi:cytochrome c
MVGPYLRGGLLLAAACAEIMLAAPASAQAVASQTVAPQIAARGRILFLRCSSCHDISSGSSPKIGPNLKDVVGRRAGSLPGYSYSPALKAQTFVWDTGHLNLWLTSPSALVPGTAMAFAGLPSETDRQAVIAYLQHPAK